MEDLFHSQHIQRKKRESTSFREVAYESDLDVVSKVCSFFSIFYFALIKTVSIVVFLLVLFYERLVSI